MMKKLLLVASFALFLIGCATSVGYVTDKAVDANQVARLIDVRFFYDGLGLTDNGRKADWSQISATAGEFCKNGGGGQRFATVKLDLPT